MYSIESTRSGAKTLLFKGKAIHSKIDPFKEGAQFIKEHQDLLNLSMPKLFIFIGNFGLGYSLSQLQSPPYNLSSIKVLVVSFTQEQELFNDHGLKSISPQIDIEFVNPSDTKDLYKIKERIAQTPIKNVIVKSAPYLLDELGEPYKNAFVKINTIIKQQLFNLLTDSAFGKRWWHNFLLNYKNPQMRFLSQLEVKKKVPVLMVGSGYSTYQYLWDLKKKAKNYIVISVLPALGLLLNEGITPDIVFITDGGEANRHYTDIKKLNPPTHKKAIVCCYGHTFPTVLDWFDGKILYFNSGLEMEPFLTPSFSCIPSQGSVASSILYLASHIGSLIDHIGFDFCYKDNHPHFPSSPLEINILLKSHRLSLAQTYMARTVYKKDSVKWGRFNTSKAMKAYGEHFMGEISRLTQKGLSITEFVRREDVLSPLNLKEPLFDDEQILHQQQKKAYMRSFLDKLKHIQNDKDYQNPLIKLIVSRALLKSQDMNDLLDQEIRFIERHFKDLLE